MAVAEPSGSDFKGQAEPALLRHSDEATASLSSLVGRVSRKPLSWTKQDRAPAQDDAPVPRP